MLFFLFCILNINAQEISAKDNALLDDFIKSKISVVKEKIVSDTLAMVFAGTFYKIDAGFAFTENMSSSSSELFAVKDGNIYVIEKIEDMSPLVSLVKSGFYLKSEADARIFEAAIDKIYPVSDLHLKDKEHLKVGNKWYFIRDTFFDSKSGFTVTLDQNSKIVSIAYNLEAIKK
jgi:hypothetical protein